MPRTHLLTRAAFLVHLGEQLHLPLDVDMIDPATHLAEAGFDSLALVEAELVIAELVDDLASREYAYSTVNDLYQAYVRRHIAAAGV